jgi:hypothetical protein
MISDTFLGLIKTYKQIEVHLEVQEFWKKQMKNGRCIIMCCQCQFRIMI